MPRRLVLAFNKSNPAESAVMVNNSNSSFTEKQGQYLAFIYNYTQIHGLPPAEADMQKFFRVTPPSVHQMVLKLEQLNLLSRVPGQPRSLQVLVPPEQLPVLVRP
jgi:DNA-binding MarR family transcriptional regulator